MRVISGLKKGHNLKAPKGKETRPTEDRIKESLFNILGYIDEDSMVLDLFAGSGAIGIEFLSRGAASSYFIDKSSLSIKSIKANLEHTDFKNQSKIIRNDSIISIKLLGDKNLRFNYIFIDPPYGKDLIIKSIEKIGEEDILDENGIIIVEHEKTLDLSGNISKYKMKDSRKYGSKKITFYKKQLK